MQQWCTLAEARAMGRPNKWDGFSVSFVVLFFRGFSCGFGYFLVFDLFLWFKLLLRF
jgi:hypothetical protein